MNTNDDMDVDEAAVFEYLDALRESRVTNMFGATPYLEQEFGLACKEARGWLSKWMKTYSERHD